MKNQLKQLQVREMMDYFTLQQMIYQFKQHQCFQLATYCEELAKHKFHCALHYDTLPLLSVEQLLTNLTKMFEKDYQEFKGFPFLDIEKASAIHKCRKAYYLKCVDLLHDCVKQEDICGYRCIQCGYTSDVLDDSCPICQAHQGYFKKQE